MLNLPFLDEFKTFKNSEIGQIQQVLTLKNGNGMILGDVDGGKVVVFHDLFSDKNGKKYRNTLYKGDEEYHGKVLESNDGRQSKVELRDDEVRDDENSGVKFEDESGENMVMMREVG